MTEPITHTLTTDGAVLRYDVREGPGPVLFLFASPMDAAALGELAAHFPDRTVVTYDPRGAGRSELTEKVTETTPEQHADDLSRVIAAVGGGPVDAFATSGGAINALALVTRQPDLLRTLVAHEPPLCTLLPDREAALAATQDIDSTYQKSGLGPAMAKFITLVMIKGPVPDDFADRPVDPAMFGLPTEDDGSRTDPLVGLNIITCTHYEPDIDALRAATTRIVVAVGAESEGELARRGGEELAGRLGTEAVIYPSHHAGFLGEAGGMKGDPDGFAAALRRTLEH